MLPPEVNNLTIRDSLEYDKPGNTLQVRIYRFWIGAHGPFTEKFYANEQDSAAVERRINALVLNLRTQGAIS